MKFSCSQPPVPQAVNKFTNTDAGRPVCGLPRIHHGRADDEDVASRFYHGVSTAGSLKVFYSHDDMSMLNTN